MGYFKEGRKTKRVELLSDSKYWVEVYTDILWGESKDSLTVDESGTVISQFVSAGKMLPKIIVDWNLDDENGKKVEITAENIDLLKPEDAIYIATQAGQDEEQSTEAKKN